MCSAHSLHPGVAASADGPCHTCNMHHALYALVHVHVHVHMHVGAYACACACAANMNYDGARLPSRCSHQAARSARLRSLLPPVSRTHSVSRREESFTGAAQARGCHAAQQYGTAVWRRSCKAGRSALVRACSHPRDAASCGQAGRALFRAR